jgi:hypothetical protein
MAQPTCGPGGEKSWDAVRRTECWASCRGDADKMVLSYENAELNFLVTLFLLLQFDHHGDDRG